MIENIAVRSVPVAAMALVVLFSGWTTTTQAEDFTAVVGNERLTLSCDGSAVVDTPCRIGAGVPGESQSVRFTAQSTRYAHLLKLGIEKVTASEAHPLRPSASDVQLLRGLALDKCHPAAESDGLSGDVLQLCTTGDSSRVVLFMRGLCDHCGFEPVVLKKHVAR